MKSNTFVNHPPEVAIPADNRPLVAPIYQSVKFSFDDVEATLRYQRGEREGFFYSRSSNPTLAQLERLLKVGQRVIILSFAKVRVADIVQAGCLAQFVASFALNL